MSNKRRKEEPPASSPNDESYTLLPRIHVDHSTPASVDRGRIHSRYDSGIHSGVGDSLGDDEMMFSLDALRDTPLEELEDVFERADGQEVLLLDTPLPFATSTPDSSRFIWGERPVGGCRGRNTSDLIVPPQFNRENGVLTPRSYNRLRFMSEGSNEDFQEEFNNGILSHPDIQADVIAIRLCIIADSLNNHYYDTPSNASQRNSAPNASPRDLVSPSYSEDATLDEIAARLCTFGSMMDCHYFRRAPFLQAHKNLIMGCMTAAAVALFLCKRW